MSSWLILFNILRNCQSVFQSGYNMLVHTPFSVCVSYTHLSVSAFSQHNFIVNANRALTSYIKFKSDVWKKNAITTKFQVLGQSHC